LIKPDKEKVITKELFQKSNSHEYKVICTVVLLFHITVQESILYDASILVTPSGTVHMRTNGGFVTCTLSRTPLGRAVAH